MSQLLHRSASELAALVASGELSARELVAASLQRIDELEPRMGAFTHVAHEQALADAAAVGPGDPRPFAGVPIAIKDNRAVAGMPITMCSDLFGDLVPRHDAFLVRRLREAGFIIVGKTKLPEMGILPTTEPRRFGATHNPWDLNARRAARAGDRRPRSPRAWCRSPTATTAAARSAFPPPAVAWSASSPPAGAYRSAPRAVRAFSSATACSPARSATPPRLLDVLSGYEPGDATWAPPPSAPYVELAAADPGACASASRSSPRWRAPRSSPAGEQAAREAAALLEALGHEVEEIAPPWARGGLLEDFTRAFGPQISMATWVGAQLAGRDPTSEDVEPLTWAMWQRANQHTSIELLASQSTLEGFAREIVTFLAPYDIVVTPALATRPVRIGEIHGKGPDPMDHYRRSGAFTPYTAICNVTGLPAISIPLYHGEDGLPLAVQLIGPPAREEVLLRVAAQLERERPWADRRPDL